MKSITMENGTVKINGGIFIIPNSATKFCHMGEFWQNRCRKYMEELCELNGITFNPDDYLIECWYHSDECDCDNIPDHGISCMIDGKKCYISSNKIRRMIPSQIFGDHVEGDIITVKIPATIDIESTKEEYESKDIILEINLELNQKDYRYGRFGNFEDVLKQVIDADI